MSSGVGPGQRWRTRPLEQRESPDLDYRIAFARVRERSLHVIEVRTDPAVTVLSDPGRRDTGASCPITTLPSHILTDGHGIVRDIVSAVADHRKIVTRAQSSLPPTAT